MDFMKFILTLAGVAEGSVDERFGKIEVIRLRVLAPIDHWVILSEVQRVRICH